MGTDLVQIDFHGDTLEAVERDGHIWVSVRRVCEALGLQPHGQQEKLRGKEWAVTQIICLTASDGKTYETYCIHLDSLPMWLATIEPNRVKEAARHKLVIYQREAAKVLAEHFIHGRATSVPLEVAKDMMRAMAQELIRELEGQRMLTQAVRIQELITVEQRCAERWPQATPKNRARVRYIMVGRLMHHGKLPYKIGVSGNAPMAVERADLAVLDQAIDQAQGEIWGRQKAGMFEPSRS